MHKIKNRGVISNPDGRFELNQYEQYEDGWFVDEEDSLPTLETILYPEQAKTIISSNDSPDIGFEKSINPYKGCEHGCVYCYARPSHSYMNLSAGLDFETKIFYKANAAELLEKEITKKNYVCQPIMLGANTDPYQPAEKSLKITRSLLEILNKYNHPVLIITKSAMIERDLDILEVMAERNLVRVAVSVTTLSNSLKLILEPRTSGPKARLRTISNLTKVGVPVRVMVAPIIPMINDKEIESILEAAKKVGATYANYVLIRLPYEVKDLFKEWLTLHFPDRATHVMSLIKQMREGKEYDATFGKRMVGEGLFAELIHQRFRLARKKWQYNEVNAPLDVTQFKKDQNPQLSLFG